MSNRRYFVRTNLNDSAIGMYEIGCEQYIENIIYDCRKRYDCVLQAARFERHTVQEDHEPPHSLWYDVFFSKRIELPDEEEHVTDALNYIKDKITND